MCRSTQAGLPPLPIVLGFLLLTGSGARPAHAQIGHDDTSIESRTILADRIVRATVKKFTTRFAPPQPQTGIVNGWAAASLEVQETLKGPASKKLLLLVHYSPDQSKLDQWLHSREPVLFFLIRGPGTVEEPPRELAPRGADVWSLVSDHVPGGSAVELKALKGEVNVPQPVLTMDLRALETADKVQQAVRSEVRRQTGRPRVQMRRISIPAEVMRRTGTHGDGNRLLVPADARLEKLGRAWIQTAHLFTTNRGVEALEPFRTSANIRLAKRLLTDPAYQDEMAPASDGGARGKQRYFYIREAAFHLFAEWNMAVPRPVIRVPLPN